MTQQPQLWNFEINTKVGGEDWSINLTASEDGPLKMLIGFYGVFETKLKETVKTFGNGGSPYGLLDELLFVNRCMIERALYQIQGQHVKTQKVGK